MKTATEIDTKLRAYDTLTKKMITTGFHVIGEVTMFNIIDQYVDENLEGKGSLERYSDIIITQFSGWKDKGGVDIYAGDVVELINEDGDVVRATCKFGKAIRQIFENEVEICGFYFELENGLKTFPIINNYKGVHDTEMFEVVGNIF